LNQSNLAAFETEGSRINDIFVRGQRIDVVADSAGGVPPSGAACDLPPEQAKRTEAVMVQKAGAAHFGGGVREF
jgi:hypothetical protein